MTHLPTNQVDRASVLVDTFLDGQGTSTREAYRRDLKCFQNVLIRKFQIRSFNELLVLNAGEINFLVLQYRDILVKDHLSPATVNRRLGAVRSIFKLARLLGYTTAAVEVPNLKSQNYRDTRGPGLPAFKRMMLAAKRQSGVKAARDRAILRLLFDLALRASELVSLDIVHLELSQKRVSIKGKGRKEREFLTLPQTSIQVLNDWLNFRGLEPGPLFTNLIRDRKKRKRLSRIGLYELVRTLGEQASVKTRPHGIRHLSITEACEVAQNNGFALEEVMDHSRHKSVATLMIYRDRKRDSQGAIATLVSNTIFEEDNNE